MSKILDKFLGVIGVEVEEEDEITGMEDEQWLGRETSRKQRKNNVLNLPTQRPVTVMLVKAKSYDEVESIAQHIKERRSVVVNLEDLEKDAGQRMVDFLSGTVFALDGTVQKVAAGTFIFATNNVDVVGQINEVDKENAFFKCLSRVKK